MPSPKIFISYSRKDAEWKDRVVGHLQVLAHEGEFDVWADDRIAAGADWLPDIERAMDEARVAILLVTADFLTSPFIRRKEVPRLLERRKSEGMLVIPLIARPVAWKSVSWLASIGARPADGKPLSAMEDHEADEALAALAVEISQLLAASGASGSAPPRGAEAEVAPSRLPATGRDLFGRDAELAMLDAAWDTPGTHVVVLVGWGGLGKSSLVGEWRLRLLRDGGRGAERVFDWSFSNQGAPSEPTSADTFVDAALRWFGDSAPTEGTPWSRGERLARLVRSRRTLLVLDGLEPLQAAAEAGDGELRDPALQALLRALAERNSGLCVITTRLPVADLRRFEDRTVVRHDLERLSPADGARILRAQGVRHGTGREMEDASREFGGHPLALTLLGSLLADAYEGDVRRRSEIGELITAAGRGGQAERLMASYVAWLGDGPEVRTLRIVSLFDRPAELEVLEPVIAEPAIPALTDGVPAPRSAAWRQLLARLRRTGLLSSAMSGTDAVDVHPLVRSYFREQLRERFPETWREANRRLLEHLAAAAPERPDTLEEMAPLLAAIAHACRAGDHQRANDILWERVYRGEEFYLDTSLGANGEELSALGHFFEERWSRPLTGMPESLQNWVRSQAAATLVLLGRLDEAAAVFQYTLHYYTGRGDWQSAYASAGHLAQCFGRMGPLSEALAFARQAVDFAERSRDLLTRVKARVELGLILRETGELAETTEALEWAMERAGEAPDGLGLWGAMAGLHLGIVLIDLGRLDDALALAERCHRVTQASSWPRIAALGNAYLGRTHLACAARGGPGDLSRADAHLEQALAQARRLGDPRLLIPILRDRAALSCGHERFDSCRTDLTEALALAESCRMRVYAADLHLAYTRLHLARGDRDEAAASLERARTLVRETEYRLRERDLAELEAALG